MPKITKLSCLAILTLALRTEISLALNLEPVTKDKAGRVITLKVSASPGEAAIVNDSDPTSIARQFIKSNQTALRVSNLDDLVALPLDSDQYGKRQVFHQTYKGIPVEFGELYVHMDTAGHVKYVKTKIADGLPDGVTPKLSQEAAVASALALATAESNGAFLKILKSGLIILPLHIVKNTAEVENYLAWKIQIVDTKQNGGNFSKTYYIDAVTGQKVHEQEGNRHLNRKIYDCAGGANGATCQVDVESPLAPGYFHGRSEAAPVRGPYPHIAGRNYYWDSEDVDNLHSWTGALQNYYSTTFGINGVNGYGGLAIWPAVPADQTRAIAHPDTGGAGGGSGDNCPGGAWFNTNTGSIYFCRGVALRDVVAHEFSHGTVFHAYHDINGYPIGNSYYGENGAIDEGHADFVGEFFEILTTGSSDWYHGTDAEYGRRNPANPHSESRFVPPVPFPDRFYDSYFYCGTQDNGGAHANSTLFSHFAYLASVGGEHNGCAIGAIGADKLQRIVFRGWRNYFSSSANFNEMYGDILQACADQFPPEICVEVAKAMQAVELDQPGRCSATPERAPYCAVNNFGSLSTCWPSGVSTSYFAPNEIVAVDGSGGIPGSEVKVLLLPHNANRSIGEQYVPLIQVTTTVGSDGLSFSPLGTITESNSYDVIVDGNMDGAYQPWADSVKTISVSPPFDGDGICYQGQTYGTSENCMDFPIDCGCADGFQCQGIFLQGSEQYVCSGTQGGGGSGVRVRGKLLVQQHGG